jgi:hypothetical protein
MTSGAIRHRILTPPRFESRPGKRRPGSLRLFRDDAGEEASSCSASALFSLT